MKETEVDPSLKMLGAHWQKLRRQKGLSLRQMASLCNIDNSRISKIEKGQINITILTLMELAKALEVTIDEMLRF